MFYPNASGEGIDTPTSPVPCNYDDHKLCATDTLYAEGGERPYWRGWYHKYFALLFVSATFVLWRQAETTTEMLATAIFAAFNTIAFTTSYLYHCVDWTPLHEIFMEKCDHAAIFLNVAGNVSQLCLLSMRQGRMLALVSIWTLATLSAAYVFIKQRKSAWHKAVCGSVVILALPELVVRLSSYDLTLLALTYVPVAAGLVVYALQWPDPKPGHFGYHELMHALVCAGAVFSLLFQYRLLAAFDPMYCVFSDSDSPTLQLWNSLASMDLQSVAAVVRPMLATAQSRLMKPFSDWLTSSFPAV